MAIIYKDCKDEIKKTLKENKKTKTVNLYEQELMNTAVNLPDTFYSMFYLTQFLP